MSNLDIEDFLIKIKSVSEESFRVLKNNKYCAILMGDTRRKKHIIPLGFRVMDIFMNSGFVLKEIIIKEQHNCKFTNFWYARSIEMNFLLIAHEYLFVFRKPWWSKRRHSLITILYKVCLCIFNPYNWNTSTCSLTLQSLQAIN